MAALTLVLYLAIAVATVVAALYWTTRTQEQWEVEWFLEWYHTHGKLVDVDTAMGLYETLNRVTLNRALVRKELEL